MESIDQNVGLDGTRYTRDERFRKALEILRDGRVALLDFLLGVLDPTKGEFSRYRNSFFANASGKLDNLLDRIFEDDKGHAVLLSWMEPHALGLVSDKISKEMDAVKDALRTTIHTTTPDNLLTWNVDQFVGPLVERSAPILGHILEVAAVTERAKKKNKKNKKNLPITACNVIVTQLAKERSRRSSYFATPFTLFLWTNGASRQTIEALHKCGICISFTALANLLDQLASESLERARRIAHGPHILCWDNINIKMSIHVEQRDNAPSKVQSGTFAILYEIQNSNPNDLRLSPMMQRAQQAADLEFYHDIRPTFEQQTRFRDQVRIHIVDIMILLKCCSSFDMPVGKHPRHSETIQQYAHYVLRQHGYDRSSVRKSDSLEVVGQDEGGDLCMVQVAQAKQ